MTIAREPKVPPLSQIEINHLTKIVFGPLIPLARCDVIFVFGGVHPGHWQTALTAYQHGMADKIIVTGGRSNTNDLEYQRLIGTQTECAIIVEHLLAAGVPKTAIISEDNSTNSLENVVYACEKFDFKTVKSVLFVTKEHVVGRHWRTLAQYLPADIKLIPDSFPCVYEDTLVTRTNWMDSVVGRKRVWGEYLRINAYSKKGDIKANLN